jgi:hypothetical protein
VLVAARLIFVAAPAVPLEPRWEPGIGPDNPIPAIKPHKDHEIVVLSVICITQFSIGVRALADCSKARSVSLHDRCKAVYEGF